MTDQDAMQIASVFVQAVPICLYAASACLLVVVSISLVDAWRRRKERRALLNELHISTEQVSEWRKIQEQDQKEAEGIA